MKNEIVIYQSGDGLVKMEALVDTVNETVWATQKAMAQLFGVSVPNISYHFKKIFSSGELDAQTVIKEILITAQSGVRGVSEEKVRYYNLDAILSLGYRVNSVQATAFRKWATSVLKQYMMKGYAVNHNAVSEQKYEDLKRALGLLENVFGQNLIMAEQQAKELFAVVKDYTYALDTLDAYDHQNLEITDTTLPERFHATYENAMEAIQNLKAKFNESQLFGVEKDKSFHSSIGQIYQTWDGHDLYPSVEEKAAMLLYLVVKNHSFVDGNKRIAATLFLWFLQNNGILYRLDGTKRIADGTLVSLTLMIAESRMDEMDILVKVVVNLINRRQ
jgi:prophage maintenance system killer protein/prophage antirepressor-like protein